MRAEVSLLVEIKPETLPDVSEQVFINKFEAVGAGGQLELGRFEVLLPIVGKMGKSQLGSFA